MQWRVVDQYHEMSDCGRYTVSRAVVTTKDGKGSATVKHHYQAWRGPSMPIAHVIAYDEAEDRAAARRECEQACEAHARGE